MEKNLTEGSVFRSVIPQAASEITVTLFISL